MLPGAGAAQAEPAAVLRDAAPHVGPFIGAGTLATMNPANSAPAFISGQRLGRLDGDLAAFDAYTGQPKVDARFPRAAASPRTATRPK